MGLETQIKIVETCDAIKEMLLTKNRAYGDSALTPIRIFARSYNIEQLNCRIDDKINRIKNGTEYLGDNDIDDLIGYLVLLKIASTDDRKCNHNDT